jgi:hypothetical protein
MFFSFYSFFIIIIGGNAITANPLSTPTHILPE